MIAAIFAAVLIAQPLEPAQGSLLERLAGGSPYVAGAEALLEFQDAAGGTLFLRERYPGRRLVLLHYTEDFPPEFRAADLEDAARRGAPETTFVLVRPVDAAAEQQLPVLTADDPAVIEVWTRWPEMIADAGLAMSRLDEPQRVMILVDEKGVVRRIERHFTRDARGRSPAVVDTQWTIGRAVYGAHCQRCHGADGRDASYPGTWPLTGIGRRKTDRAILRATWEAGFVSPESVQEQDHAALAVFVSGL